jgi:deoxyribonuclease-4
MRLGCHLSVAGGLIKAAHQALNLGLDCLQIFATSPRVWKQREITKNEAEAFKNACKEARLDPVVVHAPYLLNLASPDPELWKRSTEALIEQLERTHSIGACAVVVHPGSRGDKSLEWGLERVARSVSKALSKATSDSQVWLENTAGGGAQIGGTLSQFGRLQQLLDCHAVGFCLDTAHSWGAGYHLETDAHAKRYIDRVDSILGLNAVKLWHLNDTSRLRGSRHDQHQHLGRGLVGRDCFKSLICDPRLQNTPGILETPKNSRWADRRNLAYLRHLEKLCKLSGT